MAFKVSATGHALLVINLPGYPLLLITALDATVRQPQPWQRPFAGLALRWRSSLQAQVDLVLLAGNATPPTTELMVVIHLLKEASAVGTLQLCWLPGVGCLLGPLPFPRLFVVAFGRAVALVVLPPVKIGLAMFTAGRATTLLPTAA